MNPRSATLRSFLALGVAAVASNLQPALAFQQIVVSVDWQGQLVGQPDSSYGFPITEGDTLSTALGMLAFGPLGTPRNALTAGFVPGPAGLGLAGHAPCVGHLGGTPCLVEVDALSYGKEPLTGPGSPIKYNLAFSVDRHARGIPFVLNPPTVFSESAVGDAAADVFLDIGQGVGPLAPFAAANPGNVGAVDGNGMISGSGAVYRGFGLAEPCSTAPTLPNPGDDLDALAMKTAPGFPATGVYFSLDDALLDPITLIVGSGSAAAHGFTGGDVLHTPVPGGPPAVWAPANLLGLNITGALDDLDALILHENGTGVFEPSQLANDWMGGGTDMLLFSVRRGSALIGMPDSIFGLPICEGDILTTPQVGNPSPFPGIYIAAENLGLGAARAAGQASDDLDALDLLNSPYNDCNSNGVDDAVDIAINSSWDTNLNGVPDECELLTTGFCYCNTAAPAPCGNFYGPGGCSNSTAVGAILTASGTTSVTADNLVLNTVQMPLNRTGLMFMSLNTIAPVPFFDGLRCLAPQMFRMQVKNSGPTGSWNYGPGLVAWTIGNLPPPGWINIGQTWNFQSWFRDPAGPCGFQSNTSNAMQATFTP